MMNALRMVWIISKYYSDDVKMCKLLCQVAHMIGDRVEASVNVHQIFDIASADALKLIGTASSVLSEWRETYMKVRERIEVSGQHARWEFPKNLLFERTGHIGGILTELKFMVETVDDFFKFLGPELKAVTGDTEVRAPSIVWPLPVPSAGISSSWRCSSVTRQYRTAVAIGVCNVHLESCQNQLRRSMQGIDGSHR